MTLPHIPAGVQTAADVAVFGFIHAVTLATLTVLYVTAMDFRDRKYRRFEDGSQLGIWRLYPAFVWRRYKFGRWFALSVAVVTLAWVALYLLALGLVEVMA